MKNQLSTLENEVILELIENCKNETGIFTAGMLMKQLEYDYLKGKGQTIELLNNNFYEIISDNNLKEQQIRRLAKKIMQREYKWIVGKNLEFDFNDVIFDGLGYVVISDGTRIDIEPPILYKEEREAFNKVRTERLSNCPTNGKEYFNT